MKKIFQIMAGIILAFVVMFVGCGVLISSIDTESDKTANQTKVEVEKKTGKKLTAGQENALKQAQSYVDGQSFSKASLFDQLTSEFEGYSKADATFAVNNVKVNWNKEAVEAAKSYLETSSFSKQGLIEQLSSEYGNKFTLQQATQAANKVY